LRIVIYTYYSKPWMLQSGDDIRIHTIARTLSSYLKSGVVVYNLSPLAIEETLKIVKDKVSYIIVPRRFYQLIAKLVRWNKHYDLNPLMKLTHYVDELVAIAKLATVLNKTDVLYVFGSMSLASFFIRLILKWKGIIVYDPLANYAQTLYLRSRSSIRELLRYGLYLALHKLQLRYSDYIVYPSKLDFENARRMFHVRNAVIIPNPIPICFESYEEFEKLRELHKGDRRLRFVLLAGSRNKANEEAVKLTIEIFNKLPQKAFQLYITGPWQDMKDIVRSDGIIILGIVSHDYLKRFLAVSDYGLSPIFSHASGTFLKILAYIAAGLDIIATPLSLMGLDVKALRERYGYSGEIYLIRDEEDYKKIVNMLIYNRNYERTRRPILCQYLEMELVNAIRGIGILTERSGR